MGEVTLYDVLEYGHYVNEISNGQLTGGVYSERWRHKGVDYELVLEDGEVIHWRVYRSPEQKKEDFQKDMYKYRKMKSGDSKVS